MKLLWRIAFHLLLFCLLTVLTQVGGVLYLLSLWIAPKLPAFPGRKALTFLATYSLFSVAVIPPLARWTGREPVYTSDHVCVHWWGTVVLNRHYVKPEVNQWLKGVSERLAKSQPDLCLRYLDANFPFIDGFPLPPHLSHNDGLKLDFNLVYASPDGTVSNYGKSVTGYGDFAGPATGEENTPQRCLHDGHWQYDASKYLSLGQFNQDHVLAASQTKTAIRAMLHTPGLKRMFLEPHLKTRLGLRDARVRFHGCHAVRHDDHVHVEIEAAP